MWWLFFYSPSCTYVWTMKMARNATGEHYSLSYLIYCCYALVCVCVCISYWEMGLSIITKSIDDWLNSNYSNGLEICFIHTFDLLLGLFFYFCYCAWYIRSITFEAIIPFFYAWWWMLEWKRLGNFRFIYFMKSDLPYHIRLIDIFYMACAVFGYSFGR